MTPYTRPIWLLCRVSVVIAALAGCSDRPGPPPSAPRKPTMTAVRPTPKAPPTIPQMSPEEREKLRAAMMEAVPDFTLKAQEFYDEYQKDKKSAFTKYFGKVVELTGVVESMGQDPKAARSFIHLQASQETHGVMCVTVDPEPWGAVSPGQSVKLKGTWPKERAVSTATLGDCVFVETGPNPATRISAQELAREYATDKAGTVKKYDNKYVIVDGTIASKETISKRGAFTVALKGEGGVRVACYFTFFESALASSLQAGQRIKLIGQFVKPEDSNDVTLSTCLLITEAKEP